MKKLITALFAWMALTTIAFADPVEGLWRTEPDDGSYAYIRIAPCGDALCGTIARTFYENGTEYDSENKGLVIARNMVAKGGGKYEGNVYRPSNGKTYIGKMQLSGNTLVLKGCVAGGLICAAQNWTRL